MENHKTHQHTHTCQERRNRLIVQDASTKVKPKTMTTREKILHATQQILVEEGVLAANTNRIAARAEVNIATLYKHFPNKQSIFAVLLKELEDERIRHISENTASITTKDAWVSWGHEIVGAMTRFRQERPTLKALRSAVPLFKELREIDEESSRDAAVAASHRIEGKTADAKAEIIEFFELASNLVSHALDAHCTDGDSYSRRLNALEGMLAGSYDYIKNLSQNP